MYHLLTDERLLQLLRSSDEAAFNELYDRYWEKMSLQGLKVIRSVEDARDIVQEVFVSLWKRREELDIHGSLAAYLLKSVRNLSIRHIEKNITKQDFLLSLSAYFQQPIAASDSQVELRELETRIAGAVSKLPHKMQEVYLLSRHENLSYKEIARQLGIAETTVKKQVSNALKVIRAEVDTLPVALLIGLVSLAG